MNIKTIIMAKIKEIYFKGKVAPDGKVEQSPLEQPEIVAALQAYKKQNPAKYEQKKAALFARYGLNIADEPAPVKDASDVELEAVAEKVAKPKAKTVADGK